MPRHSFLQPALTWTIAALCACVIMAESLVMSGSFRVFAIRGGIGAFSALPQDEHAHTNILLLGVGDPEHSASYLTDAMMIASIDPRTESVVLISLPRDLTVIDAKGYSQGRINTLFAMAKMSLHAKPTDTGAVLTAMRAVAKDIGTRTGISIQGTLKMDFTGFERVIDSVGGVDIDVPEAITDYSFPLKEGVVGLLEIKKGPQHMNGQDALRFARSRHSTSDFDRASRQQLILTALENKVKHQNLFADIGMIRSLQHSLKDHVVSTLSQTELFAVGGVLTGVRPQDIIRMSLNETVGGDGYDSAAGGFVTPAPKEIAGSAALILPVSLTGRPGDWGQIQAVTAMLTRNREIYLDAPKVSVASSGASETQVHRLRNELIRYGFTVTDASAIHEIPVAAGSKIVTGKDATQATPAYLSRLLRLPLERETGANPAESEVRIILGKDYRFTPFEVLLPE